MTVTIGATMRYCPACATLTVEAFCPADGVATFARKKVLPSAATMSVGDIVAGKYRVQRILGVGGFGAVYEAEHTGGLGRVALKMLSPADHDEGDIRRFFREAQVTAGLRHPNTVRVFDVGQHETGALYIAMELVHGHTLEDELRARKLLNETMTEEETLDIGIDTLRSLSEAHGRGLVHRDLKPANLMLTDVDGERVVKVLDFGIALVKGSSLTGSGRALGTPAYMSPEQCSGEDVDGRSDLYALGVVLYRCLTGQPPFQDPNPLTLMMSHVSASPPPLASRLTLPVSDGLIAVIERAMAKAPADRFADARTMRAELETVQRALHVAQDRPLHKGGWDFRHSEDPAEGVIDHTRAALALELDIEVSIGADTVAASVSPPAPVSNSDATRVALRRDPASTPAVEGTGDYTRFVRRDSTALEEAAAETTADAPAPRRSVAGIVAGVGALAAVAVGIAWRAQAPAAPTAVAMSPSANDLQVVPAVPPVAAALAVPATEVQAPLAPPPGRQAVLAAPAGGVGAAEIPSAKTDDAAAKRKPHKAGRPRAGGRAPGDDDLSLPE